jgi:hypothetical protein
MPGPLDPAEAARRIKRAQLAAIRKTGAAYKQAEVERCAKLLNSPLDNLGLFKRKEWELIGLHLGDPRMDAVTLSKFVGYAVESVRRILKAPHVQKMIAAIRAEQVAAMIRGDFGAQATLKAAQGNAAKKVVATMETDDAKLGFTAAESILDRTGLGKSSAVQHHHVHEILRSFTADELDRYGKTGQPPARFADVFRQLTPIDVTPEG